MLSDRDIVNWDQRLKDQAGKGWDNYSVKRIDLSQARTNHPVRVPGEFLCISDSSSGSAVATVRLNRTSNPSLNLEEDVEIKTIFTILYISNAALVDEWIDLTIGINFEYKKKMIECGLTKTGQVIEYQAGDDGTYEAGWLKGRLNANNRTRFSAETRGGDDIVLDRATGLMWPADGNAAGANNGALSNWTNGIIYANGLNFAGFTDWRLPNAKELVSLFHFAAGGVGVPKIDGDFFVNIATWYWSSTTFLDNTTKAYRVNFPEAQLYFTLKTSGIYMLCVRKGL